jgi:taurine--2-oxoglutarate transaminase
MTAEQITRACREHTLFEWSAQSTVDSLPIDRAAGVWFWTPDGRRLLDFNSQLMCVNAGHGDARIVAAMDRQARRLAYANPLMATEPRATLGCTLASVTPGDIDVFFFTNGGAEANENAIKIARVYTGRHKILARYRSYHGATHGAIALTGDPRRWSSEPAMPGVVHVLDPGFRGDPIRLRSLLRDLRKSSSWKGRTRSRRSFWKRSAAATGFSCRRKGI